MKNWRSIYTLRLRLILDILLFKIADIDMTHFSTARLTSAPTRFLRHIDAILSASALTEDSQYFSREEMIRTLSL